MSHKDVEQNVLKKLHKEAENIPIPDSVKPEWMKIFLESAENYAADNNNPVIKSADEKDKNSFLNYICKYKKSIATAAGLCLIIGCTALAGWMIKDDHNSINTKDGNQNIQSVDASESNKPDSNTIESNDTETDTHLTADNVLYYEPPTYEEIYASMESVWKEQDSSEYRYYNMGVLDGAVVEESESVPMAGAEVMKEAAASDDLQATNDMAAASGSLSADKAFGNTNIQTVGVDEGDIVKNDGRYLYQIVYGNSIGQQIQIVDTKDGLKELARIEGFENIAEFYVWEDILVVIENKYMESNVVYKETDNEDIAVEATKIACYDMIYQDNTYHQISIYDIKERTAPKELKVFTLQGMYKSSRIADGYFYGFSRYYANPGEGVSDYDSYIPTLDGARLSEDAIYLPEDGNGTSYLVIASIDLRNPSDFVQTAGIISDSDQYYVSSDNIYVTYGIWNDEMEGWTTNKTSIMRFSYEKGTFALEAEGEIKGSLNNTFSMDEYNEHLRVVTTVEEWNREQIVDDRTGEVIGMDIIDTRTTNALYVLDENLKQTGAIEGLAEGERIYSARFFGDTGYFVTFRQVDPLFAVDLSEPASPMILSELKVSGFSEYLHFYGNDRLFGLGMEADEETGWQEGMKMSMFDISNPGDVQEIAKLHMKDYNYSEALYNHHAILIHPSSNVIGFEMEGYVDSDFKKDYVIYSYENDEFVEKFKINLMDSYDDSYYMSRGTFIGDVFYLLKSNGTVESYGLNTGEFIERIGTDIG